MPFSKLNKNAFYPVWDTLKGRSSDIDESALGFWIWEGLVQIDRLSADWDACWVVEGIGPGIYLSREEASKRRLSLKHHVNVFFGTYKSKQGMGPVLRPDSYITAVCNLWVGASDTLPQVTPPSVIIVSLVTFLDEFDIPGLTRQQGNRRGYLSPSDKRQLPRWGIPLVIRNNVSHPKQCRAMPLTQFAPPTLTY